MMIKQLLTIRFEKLLGINKAYKRGILLLAVLHLTACGSFSGLDATSRFACQAPNGVLCESMSGIYSTAMQHNLPGQQVKLGNQANSISPNKNTGVMTTPVDSGMPIRTAATILRLWIAPWEDNDGDLHDQSYVYVPIDSGRWVIEHNRQQIQETYRPIWSAQEIPKPFFNHATPAQNSTGSHVSNQEISIGTHQGAIETDSNTLLSGMITPDTALGTQ